MPVIIHHSTQLFLIAEKSLSLS